MKKGFTLIELLVVVLIIGILSAVALPQYNVSVEKSRLSEVLINISALEKAAKLYVLEQGFPSSGDIELKDVVASSGIDLSGGSWDNPTFCSNCYRTKNFYYTGFISHHGRIAIQTDNEKYGYMLVYVTNGNTVIEKTCIGNGSMGEKICKQLPDWDYVDYI